MKNGKPVRIETDVKRELWLYKLNNECATLSDAIKHLLERSQQ